MKKGKPKRITLLVGDKVSTLLYPPHGGKYCTQYDAQNLTEAFADLAQLATNDDDSALAVLSGAIEIMENRAKMF